MLRFKNLFLLLIVLTICISGCKEDKITNSDPNTDNGKITSLIINMIDTNGLSVTNRTFRYNDPDGIGEGNPATIFDTLRINANRTYYVTVTILNTTLNPADTISNKVLTQGNDYQLFYVANPNDIGTFSYLPPNDGNGNPIGLKTKWTIGGKSANRLTISLKHMPGTKPSNAPIANPPSVGTTRFELPFKVIIEP